MIDSAPLAVQVPMQVYGKFGSSQGHAVLMSICYTFAGRPSKRLFPKKV